METRKKRTKFLTTRIKELWFSILFPESKTSFRNKGEITWALFLLASREISISPKNDKHSIIFKFSKLPINSILKKARTLKVWHMKYKLRGKKKSHNRGRLRKFPVVASVPEECEENVKLLSLPALSYRYYFLIVLLTFGISVVITFLSLSFLLSFFGCSLAILTVSSLKLSSHTNISEFCEILW